MGEHAIVWVGQITMRSRGSMWPLNVIVHLHTSGARSAVQQIHGTGCPTASVDLSKLSEAGQQHNSNLHTCSWPDRRLSSRRFFGLFLLDDQCSLVIHDAFVLLTQDSCTRYGND